MDRKAILEQKRQQLNDDLATWAEETGLLKPGEFLYLTLAIAQSDKAVVSIGTDTSSRAHQHRIDVYWAIEESDWKFLLAAPWYDPGHKSVLELLKTRGNEPTSRENIQQQLGFELGLGFRNRINLALHHHCESAGRRASRQPMDFTIVDAIDFRIVDADVNSDLPLKQRRIQLRKHVTVPVT